MASRLRCLEPACLLRALDCETFNGAPYREGDDPITCGAVASTLHSCERPTTQYNAGAHFPHHPTRGSILMFLYNRLRCVLAVNWFRALATVLTLMILSRAAGA